MMRQRRLLSILPMAIAATLAAQDQPDFSGKWVLVASAGLDSSAAQSLTVRQPVARTNVFGATMEPYFKELIVEREFVGHARTDTYQIGVQGGTAGGGGSQTRFSVHWKGSRLVIETGSYSGSNREAGPYTEHTEEWQVDASGMLILSITDRGSDIELRSNTFTYRKN